MPEKSIKKIRAVSQKSMHKCFCCGHEYKAQEGNFFKSSYSKLWVSNNGYMPVCKICLENLMNDHIREFGQENALKIICYYLDIPFIPTLYKSLEEKNDVFTVGSYTRVLNTAQYRNKTFVNSLFSGDLNKTTEDVREERETRWQRTDKQNMSYVISVVGYDPFDNLELTDEDRRFCFNTMAGYCDLEGVREDHYKRASCIQIVNNQLQCKKLDELINKELVKALPNEGKLKTYTTSKTSLLSNIAQLSKDNNIASNYNGTSKAGKNTLSQKMKDMFADGIDSVRVNLFDINTCEWMKQVADCSNRSIMEELSFDANDYTQMIKDQREIILKLQKELDTTKEEYRLCNNELIDLKNGNKKKK